MTTTNTSAIRRLNSDQGSAGAVVAIGLGLLALVWSYGWLAPISSATPGAPDYENQAGNDFINGFKDGYANQTQPSQEQGPGEVAQS